MLFESSFCLTLFFLRLRSKQQLLNNLLEKPIKFNLSKNICSNNNTFVLYHNFNQSPELVQLLLDRKRIIVNFLLINAKSKS